MKETFKENLVSSKKEGVFLSKKHNTNYYENKNISEIKKETNLEEKKKLIFDLIINTGVYDSVIKSLNSVGFKEEEILEFETLSSNLLEEEYLALISSPFELKNKYFLYSLKEIRAGNIDMSQMIKKLISNNLKQERFIAYHASKEDILPRKNKNGDEEWVIYGTEKDHRDDDLYMAYYSKDYQELYRKKNPSYLYAVSIIKNGNDINKSRYNNGGWGRDSSLSVIEKFDLRKVDDEIKDILNEYK